MLERRGLARASSLGRLGSRAIHRRRRETSLCLRSCSGPAFLLVPSRCSFLDPVQQEHPARDELTLEAGVVPLVDRGGPRYRPVRPGLDGDDRRAGAPWNDKRVETTWSEQKFEQPRRQARQDPVLFLACLAPWRSIDVIGALAALLRSKGIRPRRAASAAMSCAGVHRLAVRERSPPGSRRPHGSPRGRDFAASRGWCRARRRGPPSPVDAPRAPFALQLDEVRLEAEARQRPEQR
jgi:hypothetical protein